MEFLSEAMHVRIDLSRSPSADAINQSTQTVTHIITGLVTLDVDNERCDEYITPKVHIAHRNNQDVT